MNVDGTEKTKAIVDLAGRVLAIATHPEKGGLQSADAVIALACAMEALHQALMERDVSEEELWILIGKGVALAHTLKKRGVFEVHDIPPEQRQ